MLVTDSYQCNEIQERLITFMSNSILNHILEFNNCHRIPPSPELAAPVMQKLFKIDRKVYFCPHTHTHTLHLYWILECVHVVDPICARFKLLKKNLIERAETYKRRRRKICPWFKPEVFFVCVWLLALDENVFVCLPLGDLGEWKHSTNWTEMNHTNRDTVASDFQWTDGYCCTLNVDVDVKELHICE